MDALWESLWQDLRYSLRTLLRTPAFTAAAVLSLALGVGANTTLFTLINALFLNPLPVDRPGELVTVNTLDTKNTTQFGNIMPLSYPNLVDLRTDSHVFSGFAGYSAPIGLALSDDGEPEPLFAQLVTGNYFDVLGLRPAAGRFFLPQEDRTPGTHPVVVLNHRFWQRRFGGRSDVVGSTIRLNAIDFTIVGVAPNGFLGVTTMFGPDAWLPAMMAPLVLPRESAGMLTDRAALSFNGAARLAPGVTLRQAETQLSTAARTLEKSFPGPNTGRGISVLPLAEATIFPGMRQGLLLGSAVLMIVVGLVLLIACSNVANLLLARASSRRQELAIRLALGAGPHRLIQQVLTESVVLAAGGGALGFLAGMWGRNVLWSFRPVPNNFIDLTIDGRVIAFGAGLSLLTAVVFGIAPAWQASRSSVGNALAGARAVGSSGRGAAVRHGLVVGQMALSLAALVAAALFLRSIEQAYAIDPGFDASKLAVLSVNPQQARYDQPRTERFYREVRERLEGLPGVESISWATNQPLWAKIYRRVALEGRVQQDGTTSVLTLVNTVDVDYFKTLGVALRRGRDFTRADRPDTRPIALVNDTMAAKYWPEQDPVGRRVQFEGEPTSREIVGVVETTKYQTLGEAPQSCIFLPLAQNYSDAMVLYVRTRGEPASIVGTLQREVRALGHDVPISYATAVQSLLHDSLWMVKFGGGLLGTFGILALVLASVGIYGVTAYSVAQRTREMGLRIALGASPSAVRRLVLGHAMKLVGVGLGLGLVGALLLGRAMSSLLYGLRGTDALSLAASSLTLVLVAALASYLPAARASRIDPAISLREA
jgi:macrolide transport system ATP-binding/permease protein